jgi:hypothetical protein
VMMHVVPVSGGKDSTALALRLAEVEPRDYTYLITPTGNELPEMLAHWGKLECILGKKFVRITNYDLEFWIKHFNALPNWRQRWCTRLLKIEPCLAWVRAQSVPVTLYVGLRADEEERQGIYSSDVITDFPLRRFGWGLPEVQHYLVEHGIRIPKRTECAHCYGQRVHEWKNLWREHPEIYARGEALESKTGFTFRSPGRDRYPAALVQLRTQVFEKGQVFKEDQLKSIGATRRAMQGMSSLSGYGRECGK